MSALAKAIAEEYIPIILAEKGLDIPTEEIMEFLDLDEIREAALYGDGSDDDAYAELESQIDEYLDNRPAITRGMG